MEMGGELVWQWTVTQRAPRYRAAVALIFEKLLFEEPGEHAQRPRVGLQRLEQRLEQVVAVVAATEDMQHQIEFRRGRDLHASAASGSVRRRGCGCRSVVRGRVFTHHRRR